MNLKTRVILHTNIYMYAHTVCTVGWSIIRPDIQMFQMIGIWYIFLFDYW